MPVFYIVKETECFKVIAHSDIARGCDSSKTFDKKDDARFYVMNSSVVGKLFIIWVDKIPDKTFKPNILFNKEKQEYFIEGSWDCDDPEDSPEWYDSEEKARSDLDKNLFDLRLSESFSKIEDAKSGSSRIFSDLSRIVANKPKSEDGQKYVLDHIPDHFTMYGPEIKYDPVTRQYYIEGRWKTDWFDTFEEAEEDLFSHTICMY